LTGTSDDHDGVRGQSPLKQWRDETWNRMSWEGRGHYGEKINPVYNWSRHSLPTGIAAAAGWPNPSTITGLAHGLSVGANSFCRPHR
jgi:hypothetical protein